MKLSPFETRLQNVPEHVCAALIETLDTAEAVQMWCKEHGIAADSPLVAGLTEIAVAGIRYWAEGKSAENG